MDSTLELWTQYQPVLRRFVARRVRDCHAAEDIVQEVMLKAEQSRASLPPADRRRAWLLRIARNAIIDFYRRRGRQAQLAPTPVESSLSAHHEDGESASVTLARCLRPMMIHLPAEYAAPLVMADLQGVSQQEIASQLGISLSGAKSRIQRARARLRDMLLDCCRIEQDGRGRVIEFATTSKSRRYCQPGQECPATQRITASLADLDRP